LDAHLAAPDATGRRLQRQPRRSYGGAAGHFQSERDRSRPSGHRRCRLQRLGRRAVRTREPVRAAVGLRELWNLRVRRPVVHALYHPAEVGGGRSPAARPRGERSPVGGGGPARVPPPHLPRGVRYRVFTIIGRMLRLLTAGESHGKELVAVLEGLPAGVPFSSKALADELARRRHGYGRGGRQRFEADAFEVVAGVRHGLTLGSPIAVTIPNVEWEQKYRELMSPEGTPDPSQRLTRPRPGHAALVGTLKDGFGDG